MYLKKGEIVLFLPNNTYWRKGFISSNNFAQCNLPDFFGKPQYSITELEDDDPNEFKVFDVEADKKYVVKFEPGMEWCIGKDSNYYPQVRNIEKEKLDALEYKRNHLVPFDKILIYNAITKSWEIDFFQAYLDIHKDWIKSMCHGILGSECWTVYDDSTDSNAKELLNVNDDFVLKCNKSEVDVSDVSDKLAEIDKQRWKNQFKDVTWEDYTAIPGIKEAVELSEKWNDEVREKFSYLTSIIQTIYEDVQEIKERKNIEYVPIYYPNYPHYPSIPDYPWNVPGTPTQPWYEWHKIYCEHDDTVKTTQTGNLETTLTPQEYEDYRSSFTTNISGDACTAVGGSCNTSVTDKSFNEEHCVNTTKMPEWSNVDTVGLHSALVEVNNSDGHMKNFDKLKNKDK